MGSKLLVSYSDLHSKNIDYSNLYDKYNDIFKEFKGIPIQHDIENYKNLLEE